MVRFHRETYIDAPAHEVWAILADFPNVARWAPIVARSVQSSDAPRGVGAARSCSVPGFGDVTETVTAWEEGRSFSFDWEAGGPVRGGRSTWSIRPEGEGTRVRAEIEAEMKFGLLGELLGRAVVKPQMGRMIADTLEGLKHHHRTGEVIDRAVAKRLGLKAA